MKIEVISYTCEEGDEWYMRYIDPTHVSIVSKRSNPFFDGWGPGGETHIDQLPPMDKARKVAEMLISMNALTPLNEWELFEYLINDVICIYRLYFVNLQ